MRANVSARLEFGILGPLEVRRDGVSLRMGGPRQRALLALLLCNANRVVSRERLIDELFGDDPGGSAERALRVQISRLRKALEDGGVDPRLLARPPGYLLRVEDGEFDLHEFERRVADGRQALEQGEARHAVELLREAEGVWRGRALADLEFEPFARFEVQRLEELRLLAVEQRIEAELALGRHAALCPELEALVEAHPLRERLRGQLMLALYRSGRQADALDSYRAGRLRLVEELALEPTPQLRQLEQAILEQDATLELPRPSTGSAVAAAARQTSREGPGSDPPLHRDRRHRHGPGGASHAAGSRSRVLIAALIGAGLVVVALAAVLNNDAAGGRDITAAANSVAVINPREDRVVTQISVGVQPDGIAVGTGGIWVANTRDHSLSNIDPSTRKVVRTLSLGGKVDGVAADTGELWTVDLTNHGSARRIDPTFGTVIKTVKLSPFYGTLPANPTAVAVSGGSEWFADNAAAVVRVGSGGAIVSRTNVGNHPSGIAVGAGGTWVSDDMQDTVSKIDSSGGVSATIPVGRGASGIAVGAGAVWVADTLDNSLVRIDPTTDSVTTTIPVGIGPRGVAWGDGSVWVANSGAGTVSRVNPQTDRVSATIPVGQSPQSLVVANGAVWVTVQARPAAVVSVPGTPPGVLRISRERPFQSVDPTRVTSTDTDEAQMLYETCAGLLTYPDRPGAQGEHLVPDVAQALPTVSADGRRYTFTVRHGFRFSPPSDAPVTAATFKHTIDRMLSPGVQSYERGFFGDIVGETAYNAGKTRQLAGVIAHGDKLQIRLTAPAPDLPARLAMLSFCAVPDDTPDTPQTQPIPSAGPYYIASSTPDELILKRNPNYGGHRPRVPREIVYSFGLGFANAVSQVAAGKSDYVSAVQLAEDADVPGALFQSLQRRYGLESAAARAGHQQYFANPTVSLDAFALNTARPLFASTRLRQAVNYAIDRQALVGAAGPYFGGQPTSHYLPPGMPGSRRDAVYPLGTPDLAKARKLAAGVHTHATLLTCNIAACIQTAQIIQTDLSKIGITVDITSLPIDVMYTRMATGAPWDIAWTTFSMDYADPSDFLSGIFDPALGGGLGGFKEPTWMTAIRHAYKLTGAARLQNYGRLDDALASRAAPALAWATESARDFFAPRVGCETYQPIYGIDLGNLCLRP